MLNHLPNFLTLLRMALAPFIIWLYFENQIEWAIVITIFASITDFLDGWVARALNRVTRAGAILDPVADKVLILCLFGMLYLHGAIPVWLFALSTLRNISQLISVPVLLGWKRIVFQVRPRLIPKWGSALSYVVIVLGLSLLSPYFPGFHSMIHNALLFVSVILSILELHILVTYWPRFFQILRGTHDTFE